ncbi:MAG TPA: hypothetical protein VFZ32_01580 [Micromonosporaceae bacterium]
MSSRILVAVGAVLVGLSGAAQVLAGMDDNPVWQVGLMLVTGVLAGYGTWLSAAYFQKKKTFWIDPHWSVIRVF